MATFNELFHGYDNLNENEELGYNELEEALDTIEYYINSLSEGYDYDSEELNELFKKLRGKIAKKFADSEAKAKKNLKFKHSKGHRVYGGFNG